MLSRWKDRFQVKPDRWVYVPTEETLRQGKSIKSLLSNVFSIPCFYYHFQEGGHVSAVKAHVNSAYFIHLDISDFFGRINKSRVTRALKNFFPYESSRDMANLSTVVSPVMGEKKCHLPYGFPQSTILASICLWDSALGKYLKQLSNETPVSVYVDDIIVSGDNKEYLEAIREILVEKSERSRLPFDYKKSSFVEESIVAFNIALSFQRVRVAPHKFEEFKVRVNASENQREVEGILSYVKSISVDQYGELWSLSQ